MSNAQCNYESGMGKIPLLEAANELAAVALREKDAQIAALRTEYERAAGMAAAFVKESGRQVDTLTRERDWLKERIAARIARVEAVLESNTLKLAELALQLIRLLVIEEDDGLDKQPDGPLPGFDDIIGLLADPDDSGSIAVGQQYRLPGTGGRERTASVVVSTPEFVGLCVNGKYELLPVTLFRAMGYTPE